MPLPPDPTLNAALQHASRFLASLPDRHVAATADLATLRARLAVHLPTAGSDPTQVIDSLVSAAEDGIIATAGSRFFGWVIGGTLPAALAADWLTSTWDQNAGLFATSPASAILEEAAGGWLKQLLNIPADASFAFVTGCQLAHVTALAAARNHLLAARGIDVESHGLAGTPPIRIFAGTAVHSTVPRAARLLGLGTRSLRTLAADHHGRLLPAALADALAQDPAAPTIVVLQAGDLNTGAFDPFPELIPIARQANAWVHVDGAFGLWAAASPTHCHLLAGAEHADSWATDGHKFLNVPYDCGYSFVRHPASHRAAFSLRATYLTHDDDARDPLDYTPEFSRRARAFPTYAAICQLGSQGIARLVDSACEHALAIVQGIGALPGAEALAPAHFNQGLLRFFPATPDPSPQQIDTFTDHIIAAIVASGEAFFTGTTWHGRRAMRVSVSSWHTTAADVERVVRCVATILQRERAGS